MQKYQLSRFAMQLALLPLHVVTFASATSSTFHCISINVPAGDTATSAPSIRYRLDGTFNWQWGHPLSFDADSNEYRGSMVNLRKGSTYEIEVGLSNGSTNSSRTSLRASTRSAPSQRTNRRTWFVSVSGDDKHPGTRDQPFRTIQYAADKTQAGDLVIVNEGRYQEQVTLRRSGTADKWITFKSAPGNKAILRADEARDHGFVLKGVKNVTLEGFAIEGARNSGILVSEGSSGVVLHSNRVRNVGSKYFDSGIEVGPGCGNIVISNNEIIFDSGTFTGGRMGIALRETIGGHIIYGNTIVGSGLIKDGIGGEPNFEVNGGLHCDSDIYDNNIKGCKDDGIETEGGNINVRIWGNRVSDCLVGIAVAPVIKGPCYVWRNVIINCGPAFKLGEGDRKGHGPLFLYHNTAYSTLLQDGGYAGSGGDGLFQNVRARNNLISVNGMLFYDKRQQLSNSYDYDLLFTKNPKRFLGWGKMKSPLTLDQARELGFWKHAVVADPLFIDAPDNLQLQAVSPAIDAGTMLPNFNDDFKGSAPDIGAFESDSVN